jgi:hypothetical protein
MLGWEACIASALAIVCLCVCVRPPFNNCFDSWFQTALEVDIGFATCLCIHSPACPPTRPPMRSPCSYLEACESGSMFEGLLEDDLSVYATTAANGHESSWGGWGASWLASCRGLRSPAWLMPFCVCVCARAAAAWLVWRCGHAARRCRG